MSNHSYTLSKFLPKRKDAKIVENHPNPVLLVFIGYLSLSTLRYEYPYAKGSVIFRFLCIIFVKAELATTSIKVKRQESAHYVEDARPLFQNE